jgi:murein L,D-transpeptidase YcbB/YkuD
VRLGWETAHRVIDYPAVLERALSTGRVAEELGDLAPPHPDYHRLAAALAGQRRLAERPPLPEVAPGPTLRPERDPDPIRVLALELRLQTEGYLDDLASDGLLTERIGEAVKAYQADHGLVVDGYAGRFTIAMMNATPAQRIRQIEANMERWRWMPEDLGARHVRVNTPSFQLELYENGSPDTSMRIIVGRDEWETPVFSDSVRTLVVNPTWNVPKKVAVRTVVQKILADSSYLASNDFDVLSDWGRNAVPVSPDSIDWTAYTERTFPFRLRQNPGPANALGRMKFLFPNKYAIYLHDTPDRRAFHKWVRQLSHGCIRIEEPELLADFVFAADSSWSRQKLGRALRAKKPRYFSPPRPVPIHILYFTSVAGENGETRFFGDVYGVDTDVLAALDRRRAIRDKRRGAAP